MSRPFVSPLTATDHEFPTIKGFTTAIHFGKQSKHLPGQPNHAASKSTITIGIARLQTLVEQKAGTGHWYPSSREVVDFGETIGIYRDSRTGREVATTKGTIHYSKTGLHVVPADPNPRNGHKT